LPARSANCDLSPSAGPQLAGEIIGIAHKRTQARIPVKLGRTGRHFRCFARRQISPWPCHNSKQVLILLPHSQAVANCFQFRWTISAAGPIQVGRFARQADLFPGFSPRLVRRLQRAAAKSRYALSPHNPRATVTQRLPTLCWGLAASTRLLGTSCESCGFAICGHSDNSTGRRWRSRPQRFVPFRSHLVPRSRAARQPKAQSIRQLGGWNPGSYTGPPVERAIRFG